MDNDGRPSGSPPFGVLLRQHRLAAGLSQEALAERARMSADGISALERGHRRTPQRETLALLANALALDSDRRRQFEAAAWSTAHRRLQNGDKGQTPAEAGPAGLPIPLTSFIGRQRELAEITELVRDYRLVTLTGTGGIGKTQIAVRAASMLAKDLARPVRFVDFGTVGASGVLSTVATALGAGESPNRPPIQALVSFLKTRTLLLVLDNCEHVVTDVAVMCAALLSACDRLHILATSREPIKVAGERTYRVPSLDEASATALFAERAVAVDHHFTVSAANAPLIAELCRRLDGIPLAIELAAARVNLLSLRALMERLDERLRILTGGGRVAFARHQTMRATISWSYELLRGAEQRLFERLSVFAGGFTLEAAESVTAGADLDSEEIFELLCSLAEKSLIAVDVTDEFPRYRLLETMRVFASEKLAEREETERLRRRHAEWIAELAERARGKGATTSIEPWAREFEPELENVRAAIEWSLAAGETSCAARIACGFTAVWRMNHGDAEPQRWLEHVLEKMSGDYAMAGRVWYTLSTVTIGTRRVEAAQRALELAAAADAGAQHASLYQLAQGLLETGRIDEAAKTNDAVLALCRRNAMTRSRRYAAALDMRARIAAIRGYVDEARTYYTEALSLITALGDEHEAILIRINMGELEYRAGHVDRAREFADAAVTAARRIRSRHREMTALVNLAACRLALGDIEGARVAGRQALSLAQWAPPMEVAIAVQHLATVAACNGDAARAARLCGYADAWYSGEGCERELTERRSYAILARALRERLAEAEIAALAADGALLREDQAVALALSA